MVAEMWFGSADGFALKSCPKIVRGHKRVTGEERVNSRKAQKVTIFFAV